MKIFVDYQSGPSPGVVLFGSVADLKELSSQIETGVRKLEQEKKEEGDLPLTNIVAGGDTIDWLSVEAVRDVEILFQRNDRRMKRKAIVYPVLTIVFLIMLYFAFKGAGVAFM